MYDDFNDRLCVFEKNGHKIGINTSGDLQKCVKTFLSEFEEKYKVDIAVTAYNDGFVRQIYSLYQHHIVIQKTINHTNKDKANQADVDKILVGLFNKYLSVS